jgi:two-component system, NtrC family, nitrogen regulation sensor histidine kinase NtrY
VRDDAERARRRSRRIRQIAFLCSLLALLLAAMLVRGRFSLGALLGLDSPRDWLVLFLLSSLNFIAFVVLALVLARHFVKLARERREGRLGYRFKTRMILGSVALSLLPTVMLFLFSFWLLDTSIRQVFLGPTDTLVDSAQTILREYETLEVQGLKSTARTLVRSEKVPEATPDQRGRLAEKLSNFVQRNRVAQAVLVGVGEPIRAGGEDARLEPIFGDEVTRAVEDAVAGRLHAAVVRSADDRPLFVVVGVPIRSETRARGADGRPEPSGRALVVARRFPPAELAGALRSIDRVRQESRALVEGQREIRLQYMLTLSLMTLAVLFASVWIALYVSRSVTGPIAALAGATEEVARGNFLHRVEYEAEGELAMLVDSFNAMAGQLGESRERLVRAARALEESNLALDERRAYIETVLSGLSTGVLSVDPHGKLKTANPAAARMLGLGPGPYEGVDIAALVGPVRARIDPLFRRARRVGSAAAEVEVPRNDGTEWPAAVTVSALPGPDGGYAGAVVTVEDLSELLQAERAAAWSEVARRMAHEIKNPLTPIQISAERIQRNFDRGGAAGNGRYAEVVEQCTATIIREVGALQHMVEEFSRFARMPQPRPAPSDLDEVVRTAAGLYQDRLDGATLELRLAGGLPTLQLDAEQIKRVVVNLVDNALEATRSTPERAVTVATEFDELREVVRLTVSDTGGGVDPAQRDKLFLPYFSTTKRGTGLGLAIVSHIISDHGGTIRVEDREPRGARFVVELPVVQDSGSRMRDSVE